MCNDLSMVKVNLSGDVWNSQVRPRVWSWLLRFKSKAGFCKQDNKRHQRVLVTLHLTAVVSTVVRFRCNSIHHHHKCKSLTTTMAIHLVRFWFPELHRSNWMNMNLIYAVHSILLAPWALDNDRKSHYRTWWYLPSQLRKKSNMTVTVESTWVTQKSWSSRTRISFSQVQEDLKNYVLKFKQMIFTAPNTCILEWIIFLNGRILHPQLQQLGHQENQWIYTGSYGIRCLRLLTWDKEYQIIPHKLTCLTKNSLTLRYSKRSLEWLKPTET